MSILHTIKWSTQKSQFFDPPSNEEDFEGEKKGKWVEVMPTAVWSHNTTVCRATNFTLFCLMYGVEAMLPEEIKRRSL
jgi:hypothetical protein